MLKIRGQTGLQLVDEVVGFVASDAQIVTDRLQMEVIIRTLSGIPESALLSAVPHLSSH